MLSTCTPLASIETYQNCQVMIALTEKYRACDVQVE